MSALVACLNSSNFHVFLCLLGGLCCFLPLLTGASSSIGESILNRSLTSGFYFRDSSVALLALAVPLMADVGIDLFIGIVKGGRNSSDDATRPKSLPTNIQKFACLVGLVVVPMTVYVPEHHSNRALIYICCNKCRTFMVGSIIMISLCQYNKKYWSVRSTLLFVALLSFGQITSVFTENSGIVNERISISAKVTSLLAAMILFISCFRCLYEVIYNDYRLAKLEKQILSNATGSARHSLSHVLIGISSVVLFIVMIALIFTNSVRYRIMSKFNEAALLQSNIAYLIFELTVTIMTMRMIKFDVVRGLYALNDSKKSYVRYISHELRTPLNTAFLGLRLLTDDMKASNDPKDSERYDTLLDVNLSCKTVLDILNDLLCFDKLESGILELHKQEVSVVPFVTDCVALFTVQARESNIKMSIINVGHVVKDGFTCRCTPVPPSIDNFELDLDREIHETMAVSPPIYHHESVLIDKFKMDQVVRNLISNAVKFTPKGGNINIKISHVPHKACPLCDVSEAPSRRSSGRSMVSDIAGNMISHLSARGTMGNNLDLEIGMTETLTEGSLVIEVSDTGAGISKENQKRLFTDIVQFNPEILQAGGGSGLGLWITKGIIDLHHGKIKVFSDGDNKGCTFTVEIPMLRRVVPEAVRRPLMKRQMSFSVERCHTNRKLKSKSGSFVNDLPSSSLTNSLFPIVPEGQFDPIPSRTVSDCHSYELLVVDDSRLNRKMLCKILRGAGHTCDEAEDGLLAVMKVKERMGEIDKSKSTYDAILMDYVMPNMDGPTATKEICALGYQGPIFGVTGNALDSDMEYFISCGALKIFTKPLDLSEFQLHMEAVLSSGDR